MCYRYYFNIISIFNVPLIQRVIHNRNILFSKHKHIFESNTTSKILANSSIRFLYSSTLPIKLPLDHANTNFNQNFFSPSPSVFQTRVSIYSRIFHKFHFHVHRINLHINRGVSRILG